MNEEKPGFGHYYTPVQVAEILGKDLFEVNRLVRTGILPAASINKYRWIPVKAVEDLIRSEQGPGKLVRLPDSHKITNQPPDKSGNRSKEEDLEVAERPDSTPGKKASSEEGKDYYTVEEVAYKLNKPSHEIWRMVFFKRLVVDVVEGERVFPKKSIEDFLANWQKKGTDYTSRVNVPDTEAPATYVETEEEFHGADIEEAVTAASTALGVSNEEITYEIIDPGSKGFLGTGKRDTRIKLVTVSHSSNRVPSRDEVKGDDTLRTSEEGTRSHSQHRPSENDNTAIETPGNQGIEPTEGGFHRPTVPPTEEMKIASQVHTVASEREVMKAAQRIGTSINKVRQMMVDGQLIVDPQTGRLEKSTTSTHNEPSTADKFERAAQHRALIKEAADRLDVSTNQVRKKIADGELVSDPTTGRWVHTNQSSAQRPDEKVEVNTQSRNEAQSRPDAQRTRELEERVKDLQQELRIEREEKERLSSELGQEREEHERDVRDSQYEIDQLDAELQNLRRSTDNSILGSRLKQEIERREAAERWGRDLESQLDSEMAVKAGREQWFAELESNLAESEGKRKELEHALLLERAKIRGLEEDQRVLSEVRRLLGAGDELNEASAPAASDEARLPGESSPNTGQPNDLLLETRHGEWRFRPPFPLTQEEVGLIQLVVGEDEITAEQIRSRRGRRSVEKLNDVLDRMLEAGVEPIKEANDRYSFDPDFM